MERVKLVIKYFAKEAMMMSERIVFVRKMFLIDWKTSLFKALWPICLS